MQVGAATLISADVPGSLTHRDKASFEPRIRRLESLVSCWTQGNLTDISNDEGKGPFLAAVLAER